MSLYLCPRWRNKIDLFIYFRKLCLPVDVLVLLNWLPEAMNGLLASGLVIYVINPQLQGVATLVQGRLLVRVYVTLACARHKRNDQNVCVCLLFCVCMFVCLQICRRA